MPPKVLSTIIRFSVFTGLFLALLKLLRNLVQPGDIEAFKEGGFVETFQLALLGGSLALCLGRVAWRRRLEPLPVALGTVFSIAFLRESDSFIMDHLPFVAWQVPAAAVGLAGAAWMRLNWKELTADLEWFVDGRAFGMLWAGFIMAVPFAQLVGHGDFLKALMGDDYIRGYKRVLEETGELTGFLLLLLGVMEALAEMKERDAQQPPPPANA